MWHPRQVDTTLCSARIAADEDVSVATCRCTSYSEVTGSAGVGAARVLRIVESPAVATQRARQESRLDVAAGIIVA